jgi:mRNA interferase RelE/StbE
MKTVRYSKAALKTLRRMPRPDARRIADKVSQFATDPDSLSNIVRKLKGSEFLRLRIGDWRVIMDDQGIILAVLKIGARGSVYE